MNNFLYLPKKSKILVVGQTPPPYGGQAIMIEQILNFHYNDISFIHVRMNFSSDMNDIGKVQIKKFFELIGVIFTIYKQRILHNVKILYYPPAGPNTVPILRDILILLTTRFLFKKTIFHFHAGGLSEKLSELKPIFRWALKKAYLNPDLTIRLSKSNPDDGSFLSTRRDVILPYGIDDFASKLNLNGIKADSNIRILYAGLLKESKGISILINALSSIVAKGYKDICVSLMGKFESAKYEQEVRNMINSKGLEKYINILGVKSGVEKFSFFYESDIFCFPTYFECETFGIVLLEAMQFSKPIVATRWRGVPDIVKDDENGFLVEPRDAEALSLALIKLITNKDLRIRMGKRGLNLYREKFTTEIFKRNFHNVLQDCLQ
jgi:glycosyltransferase involved in cell wall biosynthesis